MSGYRLAQMQFLVNDATGVVVGIKADDQEIFLPTLAGEKIPALRMPDGSYSTEFVNVNSAAMRRWRKAIANVRNGSGRARLALVGDSTTAGSGSVATGSNNAVAKSYPSFLANILNSYHFPAIATSAWGRNLWPATDPRVAAPNWIQSSNMLNGNSIRANAILDPLSFNPGVPWDTAEVWYADLNGCGTFTINVDGGAVLATISPNGAGAIKKAQITRALGNGVLNVARTGAGGQLYIAGMVTYDSTSPKVDVFNLGWSGSIVSDWTTTSTSYVSLATPPSENLKTVAPDLTVICLTINDSGFGTDVNLYKANLQTLVSAALTTGDVVMMSGVPSEASTASVSTQEKYINAALEVALNNNLPFINLTQRWGSYAISNALGLYTDLQHPLAIGYADVANAVASVLDA
jgi:lysophospholipase L1-like esterase